MSEKRKSNRLQTIVIGIWIGVCLGAVVVAAIIMFGPKLLDRSNLVGLETDVPAPDFELTALSGETVRLADLRGKPVVINYWATWCGPCVREMPMFQKYHDLYGDKFVMIGIDEEEPPAQVQELVDSFEFTYPMLLDTNVSAGELYQVMVLPSTFFIDAEGILRYRHIGSLQEDQFKVYLGGLGIFE
ncbi:MAG: TlpA family protein disulfide reductase [Anaerolineales bacterium]|nr:TlpA family protein disulfide reductase [Anaerolineales bacterium]